MTVSSTGEAHNLGLAVRRILNQAIEVYRDAPETVSWLRQTLARFDEPLRVAIAGKVKAGKSTLLNALVGEDLAATDAGECTRVVTWYQDGHAPAVTMFPREKAPRQLRISRTREGLRIDLAGTPPEAVDRLVVTWPSSSLRATTLIDTPGIGSLSTDVSQRTSRFLTPEDTPTAADAVLYLMRHLHAADVNFLEAFHDQGVARANPINTIGVLSRADEIGVGRLDALLSARRIAARYRNEEKLRGLCQTVVAVAGLLAHTARTMRQDEFLALMQLAKLAPTDLESLLLSADRFVRLDVAEAPSAETRSAMLARFGIFGLRVSTMLIRQGTTDPSELSRELVRRSGLDDLRQVLASQFTERRDLLKARSALIAIDTVLRQHPRPGAAALAAEVERVIAGAHEFAELRLLSDLRTRVVRAPADVASEAERLLGGDGSSPARRLGLPEGTDPEELRAAALDALNRWRRRAESPLTSRALAHAARVVVRSCEGILARLPS